MSKVKKKHPITVMSDVICACGCGKPIKQNLIDKNPDAKYRWGCFPQSKKNRPSSSPRKYRKKDENGKIMEINHKK